MTTIDDITTTITTRFDMDTHAAEESARLYLHQIEGLDGQDYDEDNLSVEVADFIIESIRQHRLSTPPTLLDEVTAAVQHLEDAHQQRDAAIRAAADAGLPVRQIAMAAGMTRQSIYNIWARA